MSDDMGKSLGERNYDDFAERYAAISKHKPHNAYLDRPAVLAALPDVDGKHVLDAGCGPGFYAEALLERGASVVAFDVTPTFVEITRRRVGERANVLQADMTEPLTFAEGATFDVVVAPLVLDYIEDWQPTFAEFYRVLKPGGVFVFSVGNPVADWRFSPNGQYYAVEVFDLPWAGFGEPTPVIRSYRRPLHAVIDPLLASGFRLDALQEPRPAPELAEIDPEEYNAMHRKPYFLLIRAVKPG